MMRRDFLTAGVAASLPGRVPVLAELFTSEGCSSCPPADALLAKLHREQPVSGVSIVVLSEHVDYWNYIGWRDPFSAAQFSRRQQSYGARFRLNSVYTPQMVIDGEAEVLGSDPRAVKAAIETAARRTKIAIALTAGEGSARVEIEAAPRAGVWLAIADEKVESSVTRGENSGRKLDHVMVVRSLERIGETSPGTRFSREVSLQRPGRVIAFAQERGEGKVFGLATS